MLANNVLHLFFIYSKQIGLGILFNSIGTNFMKYQPDLWVKVEKEIQFI